MGKTVRIRARLVHQWLKENKRGEITGGMYNAATYLLKKEGEKEEQRRGARFYEQVKRDAVLETTLENLYALAEALEVADKEKFVGALIVGEQESWTLPSGDANRGEIEVSRWSENLLADPKFFPANKYVAVYVDDVRFRQKEDDRVVVKNGKYIRIEPPSGLPGAIVLPVDAETGDVLLVTQYRHPQRRFLTEAPRGFGMLGVDQATIDTAKREMAEETGALPLKNIAGLEEVFFLKAAYTDTGKLTEKPHYFLAFVDRASQTTKLNRYEPTMEDPVWITLPVFYRAVYQAGSVKMQKNEYKLCLKKEYKKRLNTHTPIDDGILQIEDAFTCLVALLAKPHLEEKFPELFYKKRALRYR